MGRRFDPHVIIPSLIPIVCPADLILLCSRPQVILAIRCLINLGWLRLWVDHCWLSIDPRLLVILRWVDIVLSLIQQLVAMSVPNITEHQQCHTGEYESEAWEHPYADEYSPARRGVGIIGFRDAVVVATGTVAVGTAVGGAVRGCALVVIAGVVVGAGVVWVGGAPDEGEYDAEDDGGCQAGDGSVEGEPEGSGGEHHLFEGWSLCGLQHLVLDSDKIIWVSL